MRYYFLLMVLISVGVSAQDTTIHVEGSDLSYIGQMVDGKKEGLWKLISSNGMLVEEGSYAGRAWNKGLENMNKLISWLYDSDVLTKTDKSVWDRKVNKYYRYYNDGDFPKGLKTTSGTPMQKWVHSGEKLEQALERDLEVHIKMLLDKYKGRYDRTELRQKYGNRFA